MQFDVYYVVPIRNFINDVLQGGGWAKCDTSGGTVQRINENMFMNFIYIHPVSLTILFDLSKRTFIMAKLGEGGNPDQQVFTIKLLYLSGLNLMEGKLNKRTMA